MNNVETRREQIIALRNADWTYRRIAHDFGISESQVQRLYKAGLADREKRKAANLRAAATLETCVDDLGLPPELLYGIRHMALADLRSILAMKQKTFEALVRRYPNVGTRSLKVLAELRARFEIE